MDADTLVNMLLLRLIVHSAPTPVDYVGKPMMLFAYRSGQSWFNRSSPFIYMQGSLYALSPRAARAVTQCPRPGGEWLTCPNKYFRDVSNTSVQLRQSRTCTTHGSTFNNEDFLVGACLAEAGMVPRRSACFLNVPSGSWSTMSGKLQSFRFSKRCLCPVSMHALKHRPQFGLAKHLMQDTCREEGASRTLLGPDLRRFDPASGMRCCEAHQREDNRRGRCKYFYAPKRGWCDNDRKGRNSCPIACGACKECSSAIRAPQPTRRARPRAAGSESSSVISSGQRTAGLRASPRAAAPAVAASETHSTAR